MKKNLFIAFEGIDGSGKSSQVQLLASFLEKKGRRVYTTFEPTKNPIGSLIRDIFSHKMEADHRTIAGLFVADRLHHLLNQSDGILKKLEQGYTVITDRYYFSSYAYHGTHMDMDWVIEANALSAELLRPDINIFIDIDPEISMSRLLKSRETIELYETLENLRNVRNKYKEAIEKLKGIEVVFEIDGNRDLEVISSEIILEMSHRFSI